MNLLRVCLASVSSPLMLMALLASGISVFQFVRLVQQVMRKQQNQVELRKRLDILGESSLERTLQIPTSLLPQSQIPEVQTSNSQRKAQLANFQRGSHVAQVAVNSHASEFATAGVRFLQVALRIGRWKALNHMMKRCILYLATKADSLFALIWRDDAELRATLVQADLDLVFSAEDIKEVEIVSMLMGGVGVGVFTLTAMPLVLVFIGFVFGVIMGAWLPKKILSGSARDRVAACVTQLPEMIEVIALGSTAGIAFSSAVDLYCTRFSGPLPGEMRKALSAWKTGASSQEQALDDMAQRLQSVPITHFVSTVTHAVKMGSPLAELLMIQSEEARRSKRAQIEEKIAKAPVKMLLPMGTLILPAMLLLILGPVMLNMATGG